MKKSHTLRILLALLVIFGAFAYIVYGACPASAGQGRGLLRFRRQKEHQNHPHHRQARYDYRRRFRHPGYDGGRL